MLSAARKRTASCLSWVKLRNTQNEQMSSALLPRTDVGLAGPNVTRIERYGKFDERPLCARSSHSITWHNALIGSSPSGRYIVARMEPTARAKRVDVHARPTAIRLGVRRSGSE